MIDGLVLGTASFVSLFLTWRHMPQLFKKISLKHPFATDLLASGVAFSLLTGFSSSLVAVIGAVTVGILVNGALYIYEKM